MKILMIHSDFIEWEPKTKAIKSAEETEKGKKRVEEALVVFAAVEKEDEKNPEATVANAAAKIMKNAGDVKAKRIVVYPYAHLSPNLSSPENAMKALRALESLLKEKGLEASRSPFGWYKSFEIKCKGHPLSELSAQIGSEGAAPEQVSEAIKKEEKLKSHWYVAVPGDKTLRPISLEGDQVKGFDASNHGKLDSLLRYEMAKSRAVDKEPPHIALMRRLELVDYEEGTDPGNFRFYPAGRLVKSLLEDFTTREIIEYGGSEVETPIMYDLEHPTLKSYLNRFPARQYQIQTPNKRVFLRFAACFGQFLIAKDAVISYKDLPVRPYELTRYSFRVEQSGELAGLRRLRAFTMPDCHALCADMAMAKDELLRRFDVARGIQQGIGFGFPGDFEFSLRAVKSFYEENKDFVHSVVDKMGKPALLEIWDERFFYFVFKMEWNFIDSLGKAACLTTDQIDVENGERYGMAYTGSDGKKKTPILLHLSPTGSIERVMYALLEREHMRSEAGAKPMLPLWLSPSQVRIIPVSDKFIADANKVADAIAAHPIRVEVDDRSEPIGARIRKAESSWVPYIAVIGEKELASGRLAVRVRETGEQKDFSPDELSQEVLSKTAGMPFKKLSLPRSLDHRPIFVG
jgi:threonyl-tRNA synthetase